MRLNLTLFILLLFSFTADAQKLTGIWRGYFTSSLGTYRDGVREEHYKYEIQVDQQSNNGVKGVTYSYKTTVFYGKAEINGIYNPSTKSLIIKENKLVDLKVADNTEPCLMTCYLDYTKIGKLEVLEGTFISINVKDKGDCGSGKVYLERVTTSDFKKEDFLVKKKTIDPAKNKSQSNLISKPNQQKSNQSGTKIPAVPPVKKDNLITKVNPQKQATVSQQPKQGVPKTNPAAVKKQAEKGTAKNKPTIRNEKNATVTPPRVPEPLVNSKKMEEGQTLQTENNSKKIQIPRVLLERENNLVKVITTSEQDIEVDLYDNGTIDNDTISVYHNNEQVISNGRLSYTPITFKIKCSKADNRHELVVVAENLGDIPPNTALMVIRAGNLKERYEIFLASNEQRNAKVVINYVPKD